MPLVTLRKHKFKSNVLLIAESGSLIITNLLTLPYSLCIEAVHYIFRPGHYLTITNICNVFIWLINYFLMYFHWLTQSHTKGKLLFNSDMCHMWFVMSKCHDYCTSQSKQFSQINLSSFQNIFFVPRCIVLLLAFR